MNYILKLKEKDAIKKIVEDLRSIDIDGFKAAFFSKELAREKSIVTKQYLAMKRKRSLVNGEYKNEMLEHIKKVFGSHCVGQKKRKLIIESIIEILNNNTDKNVIYLKNQISDLYGLYEEEKDEQNDSIEIFAICVYQFLYLALTQELPNKVLFSIYIQYEKDYNEFCDTVVKKNGVYGEQGLNLIMSLVDKNNIFALYEMSEMSFFGTGIYSEPDYDESFDFLMQGIESDKIHPLMYWSAGYLLMDYNKEKREAEGTIIQRVHKMNDMNRRLTSYRYLKIATYFNCANAYHSLGIFLSQEDNVKLLNDIETIKELYIDVEYAKEYIIKAMNLDYPYSYNYVAQQKYDHLIKSEKLSDDEQKKLVCEMLELLEKSANLNESWACNRLGYYYYYGIVINNNTLIKSEKKIAYYYFKRAYNIKNGAGYFWATYNLITKYWNKKDVMIIEDYKLFVQKSDNRINDERHIKLLSQISKLSRNLELKEMAKLEIEMIKANNNDLHSKIKLGDDFSYGIKIQEGLKQITIQKVDIKKGIEYYKQVLDDETADFRLRIEAAVKIVVLCKNYERKDEAISKWNEHAKKFIVKEL